MARSNARVVKMFLEEARIEAFWRPDAGVAPDAARPTAVIDARPGAPTVSLIARQEVEYLAPIPYQRSPIEVELWIGRLGGASIEICYEVFSPAGVEPRIRYTIVTDADHPIASLEQNAHVRMVDLIAGFASQAEGAASLTSGR